MYYALKKKSADQRAVKEFDNEVEPEAPDLEKNNNSIIGIDSNNNGIRDDVEIWINRTGKNYNEREAMRQYARTQYEYYIQVDLLASGKTLTNSKDRLISENMTNEDCINFIFYNPKNSLGSHITNKLDILIDNTNMRKKASWNYFNSGSFVAGSRCNNDITCCHFDVQNKELIQKENSNQLKLYREKIELEEAENKKNNDELVLKKKEKYELIEKKKKEQKPLININD